MEEDGIIVKEEERSPWVSSMLVVDKRKAKDKDMNIPPSKDNVKHQRDINQKLRAMLDKSGGVDLKFNPHKVKLRVPDVNYDGRILSSERLIPLIKCPHPQTRKVFS